MTLPYAHPTLRREVGLFGAVMLGLGSILGTGVFVALPLKTAEAGLWIIPAIIVAGLVALCNALSSAQLAAAHPVAGGTYEYGYRFLKPWLGFTAGWTFLLAKSASAATAALGIGLAINAVMPGTAAKTTVTRSVGSATASETFTALTLSPFLYLGIAAAALLLVLLAAILGLRRASVLNAVLVGITLSGLITFVGVIGSVVWEGGFSFLRFIVSTDLKQRSVDAPTFIALVAFAFVAFTGYGRLATLGEEVADPRVTIPRAIGFTLATCVLVYIAVGGAFAIATFTFGMESWKASMRGETLATLAARGERTWLWVIVSLAAVTAMLGVLLNLILGLSRVWLAMARRGDAPAILARIHEPTSTPRPAVILTGVVIAALVLVGDVRLTWSFSAFTVLIYYAITNWAALKLPPEHRLYPRWIAWCGLIACASLAWFVEWQVWATGVAIIAIGLAWHAWRRRTAPALTT